MEFINSKSLYVDSNKGQVRVGSISNAVSSLNSSVLGGNNNIIHENSNNSAILGGQNNILSANNSFIVGNNVLARQSYTLYTDNVNTNGDLTLSGIITGSKTNSLNWNSVYSYTNTNSSFDQASRSFVNSNSASIINGYKGSNWVFANSATELAVTAFVNSNSASELVATAFVNSNSASIINGYKGSNWVFANSATELAVTSVVNSISANWNSVYSNVNQTSANWNSVYSNVNTNSATYATIAFTNNKFIPLSGGEWSGSLRYNTTNTDFPLIIAGGAIRVGDGDNENDLTIGYDQIGSELGIISKKNDGFIAVYYSNDNLYVYGPPSYSGLSIDGSTGYTGINTTTPNEHFTVSGNISSNGRIFVNNGNSNQWNSVYSYTNSNSSFDQASRSFVNSNSASIINGYKGSNWVFANSATELAVTSFVNSNSATILNGYKGSNWVFANSATELAVTSIVNSTSANWNSVYSNVNSNSATYATIAFANNKFLPLSGGQITGNLNVTNNLSAVNVKFTGRVEQGTGTKALGTDSHAEGLSTIASGSFGSHSEGYLSVASGTSTHAEGFNTKAIGSSSHAEGSNSIASGAASHAENGSIAIGTDSHAEGAGTVAYGGASHSEGVESEAKGLVSHAAGYKATAANNYSYAWSGDDTLTSNISSTKPRQYFIYAPSGVYIPRGQLGIGTDSQANALTVVGVISGSSIVYANNGNSNQWNSVYSNVNSNSATYATQNYVKNNFLPLSGGTLTGQLNVTSNISATQVVYSKELDFSSLERPSLTGIKQALNSFLYVAPNLEYFRINGSNTLTLEVGQSLTNPTLTWKSTKAEPQAVLKYTLTLPNGTSTVGTNTFTFSSYNDINTYNLLNIGGSATQRTSSWNVRVTDWSNAEYTGTLNVNWQYRVYFGATNQLSANGIQIISGTDSSTLATSRLNLGARTVLPSNEYVYVAYPQRFGTTSLLRLNGFNFNDMDLLTITPFTNIYGGFDNYYVYRTRNLLTGTYTVEII